MFADDTNITITAACFGDLENTVNNELESVGQWLIANKLSLNIVKTEGAFLGKIQIRIIVSKNGFCVSLPKSENGLIRD